jgi:pilus assembly protein Flp/PilA
MVLYQYLQAWLSSQIKSEEGQGMAEYALILLLIAVAVIVAITALGTNISTLFNTVSTKLT